MISNKQTQMGYPDAWLSAIGWEIDDEPNNCKDYSDVPINDVPNGHLQLPIDLQRKREPECWDVHWMSFYDGSCTWEDIVDNQHGASHKHNFFIRRHALQMMIPTDDDGKLKCSPGPDGYPLWPKLDYSKGFPEYWWMSHLEIKTPSEWTQEGKRYDAEIVMSQFYERDWDDQPRNGPLKKVSALFASKFSLQNMELFSVLCTIIYLARISFSSPSYAATNFLDWKCGRHARSQEQDRAKSVY